MFLKSAKMPYSRELTLLKGFNMSEMSTGFVLLLIMFLGVMILEMLY